MKRVVFITSHIASGSNQLVDFLNTSNRIRIYATHTTYAHPTNVFELFAMDHPLRGNMSAIYGDHLVYNITFQCKALYDWCDFIYVIRNAKDTLREIMITSTHYNPKTAYYHYCYRLRRIYEMAKKTPKAILVTRKDLITGEGLTLIKEFMSANIKFQHKEEIFDPIELKDNFPIDLLEKAQDCFEYYLYRIKALDIQTV